MAFELTVEIRSMPESLIESWRNEFRGNGNRILKEQQIPLGLTIHEAAVLYDFLSKWYEGQPNEF